MSSLRFSHDDALLASASDDGDVFVWDVATGERREHLAGHAEGPVGLAFSADDVTLYTAGFDGALLVWDLAGDRRFIARLVEAHADITDAAAIASPSGATVAYLISASDTGVHTDELQFRDLETGLLSDEIDTENYVVEDFTWRPDGRQLATVDPGLVQVWDAMSAVRVTRKLATGGSYVGDLDYTPDGTNLVVGEVLRLLETEYADLKTTISMLDADTLQPFGKSVTVDGWFSDTSAGPHGRPAIAVSPEGHFAVVDLIDGHVLREGELGLDVSRVDLSPDGLRAVVIGANDEVGILDVTDGKWVSPPVRAPRGSAGFASYMPDGQGVLVGGRNGTVSLWDGRTGQPFASVGTSLTSPPVMPFRPDNPSRPTILDDGYTAMLAAFDGAVYTWDTRPERWIAAACAIAGRNLTEDEWQDAFGGRPYRSTCPDREAPG